MVQGLPECIRVKQAHHHACTQTRAYIVQIKYQMINHPLSWLMWVTAAFVLTTASAWPHSSLSWKRLIMIPNHRTTSCHSIQSRAKGCILDPHHLTQVHLHYRPFPTLSLGDTPLVLMGGVFSLTSGINLACSTTGMWLVGYGWWALTETRWEHRGKGIPAQMLDWLPGMW